MVELLDSEKRPWGAFKVLGQRPSYVVKQLLVLPGKRLSYQHHEFRSELWLTVEGSGTAIIDDVVFPLGSGLNLPLLIHAGQKHRIINDTDSNLVIVEIWTGEELREDDIVRHEDDHGRA